MKPEADDEVLVVRRHRGMRNILAIHNAFEVVDLCEVVDNQPKSRALSVEQDEQKTTILRSQRWRPHFYEMRPHFYKMGGKPS